MLDVPAYTRPACDGSEDITDVWIDETDPLNERGDVCEGHFMDALGCQSTLIAITLTHGDGDDPNSTALPRDIAEICLGIEAITRLERIRAERLNEGEY